MSDLPPHDWHAPIIASIVDAYGRTRNPVYIEIGVDRGITLRTVLMAVDKAMTAIGVDVTFEHVDPRLHGWVNVVLAEQDSNTFFDEYRRGHGPQADVVFIDGDHAAPQVQQDIYNALMVLAPDGTIIVHDTYPVEQRFAESHCGDGWAAVDQFRQQGVLQVFTLPLFPGLTLIGPMPDLRPSS